MQMELTPHHLHQIIMGRVTVPQRCGELESVAIAHAYLKSIGRRAPDRFLTVRRGWVRQGNHWVNNVAEYPATQIGPSARIDREHYRSLVIRQNVTATIGIRVPVFITVVYDQHNIAFVDVAGHCLYVPRAEIITELTAPNVERYMDLMINPGGDDGEGVDVNDNGLFN